MFEPIKCFLGTNINHPHKLVEHPNLFCNFCLGNLRHNIWIREHLLEGMLVSRGRLAKDKFGLILNVRSVIPPRRLCLYILVKVIFDVPRRRQQDAFDLVKGNVLKNCTV